jgi:hypothetical protein
MIIPITQSFLPVAMMPCRFSQHVANLLTLLSKLSRSPSDDETARARDPAGDRIKINTSADETGVVNFADGIDLGCPKAGHAHRERVFRHTLKGPP